VRESSVTGTREKNYKTGYAAIEERARKINRLQKMLEGRYCESLKNKLYKPSGTLKSLLTACFLLMFPFAAYGNLIMSPHHDLPESSILYTFIYAFVYIFNIFTYIFIETSRLSIILLAGALAAAAVALIRVFWKPNKKRRRGARKHIY